MRITTPRPTIGRHVFPEPIWQQLASSLRLSGREFEIVQGVFDDRKELSIASLAGISPHTVNTYLQRLYRKLQVRSRPQLILRVMEEYLALDGREPAARASAPRLLRPVALPRQ